MIQAVNKTVLLNFWLIVSMIIWGGSWVSAKAIANTLPPETLTFWRFFINSISFIPVLFFLKKPIKMNKSAVVYTLLGSISMGFYLYLFFKGLTYGFAGIAGVLVPTMIPLATFILSVFLFGQKVSNKDYIGLTLGIIGSSIIMEIWRFDWNKIFMSGNIYFLICAVLWALLTICSQKAGNFVSPLIFSFFANTFCSGFTFFFALPEGEILDVFKQGTFFWLNILYLAIISSTFATTIYFFASSHLSASKASSYVFLVPMCTIIFSWIFLNEVPKISTIIGGLTAITAVYLINMKQIFYQK